jgi:CheY-like chemotaxis protein
MKLKVLVVEDSGSKSDSIIQIVRLHYDADVECVSTISSAYAVLNHTKWDLVILDMTFQVSQGLGQVVRKEALAGIELLQYMSAKQLNFPVIVATQHDYFSQGGWINISSIDELDALLSEAFPNQYRSTVHVDLASSDWHHELMKAMRRILDV